MKDKVVELIDSVSGTAKKYSIEYSQDIAESIEIECHKRAFAENLVADEWIEQGRAIYDMELGFAPKDNSAKEWARFKFACILREQHIKKRESN